MSVQPRLHFEPSIAISESYGCTVPCNTPCRGVTGHNRGNADRVHWHATSRRGLPVQIQTRWWAIALFGTIAASAVQAAPVIDNERLTVWDIKLAQGESGPATPHDQDAVILIVEGGEVRTRDRRGHTRVVTRNFGDGIFVPKGTDAVDTLVAGGPAHEVLIALKNYPRPPLASS